MANKKFTKVLIVLFVSIIVVAYFKNHLVSSKQSSSGIKSFRKNIKSIRYWKKRLNPNITNNLDVTFIECSDGTKIIDECDMYGNGVITLYDSKNSTSCFSLVKQRANIYNRNTLEMIDNNKCVKHSRLVKNEFSDEYSMTIPTFQKNLSVESIIAILKKNKIIG